MNQTNNLCVRKVAEINRPDYTFFIPSYQRGYRWDAKQVEELLEDIQEVIRSKQEHYCLQPIVVKMIEDMKSEDEQKRFEVIDGQQRLTTIYLLLLRLSPNPSELFKLEYETRESCNDFFAGLKEKKFNDDNPDFAHISTAYKTIDKWVTDQLLQSTNAVYKLLIAITETLEVIWYELERKEKDDRKDSVKIFTRLNGGKIPLTSAELIKAIFLSSENLNLSQNNNETINAAEHQSRQIELASDWNQMEYTLQGEGFWNFINKDENLTSTRIDFIFELVTRLNKAPLKKDYDAFTFFYKRFGEAKLASPGHGMLMAKEWDEVKGCFSVMSEWYADKELYHLIGYLIWAGKDILDLYYQYRSDSKRSFKKVLNIEIGKTLKGIKVDQLTYKQSDEIRKVMVLFNAISAMNSKNDSVRFPFERLKLQKNRWSLEHIHAQNAEDINQKEYVSWMEDHKAVLLKVNIPEAISLVQRIDTFLIYNQTNSKSLDIKSSFEQLAQEIIDFLSDSGSHENISEEAMKRLIDVDHVSNMALLDGKSNSALSNSVFGVKREKILIKEREGAFIPPATRNVFLKYYSDYPQHLIYWTINDKQQYVNKISEIVTPFIEI